MGKVTLTNKTKKNIFLYCLIAYPMILFAIFYVGVNAKTILMAFQTVKGGETVFAGLGNFVEVFLPRVEHVRKYLNDVAIESKLDLSRGICENGVFVCYCNYDNSYNNYSSEKNK